MSAIFSTGKGEGDIQWNNRVLGGLSEVTRTLFVSMIVFSDLFTVVQDWDFPSFETPLEADVPILVAFTFQEKLECHGLARLLQQLPRLPAGVLRFLPPSSFFKVTIT